MSYLFLICLTLFSTFVGNETYAQTPPGGPPGWPGVSHHWASALKQAVGTAYEPSDTAFSPIWFTVAEGALSEVFYPHNDQAQVGYLEFIVTDGEKYFSEQRSGPSHETGSLSEGSKISEVKFEDEGMTVHIQGEDKLHFYHFDQYIFADTASPVLRIHTEFKWSPAVENQPAMKVFVLFKPAVNNSATLNLGSTSTDGLFATSTMASKDIPGTTPVSIALLSSVPWVATSAGYVGFSDPWQDLSQHFRLTQSWHEVGAGNIALAGEVQVRQGAEFSFDLALGFGSSKTEAYSYANLSLSLPYEQAREHYENGWHSYLAELQSSSKTPSPTMAESSFARRSAQIIKMHEDKINRGAIVASLSKPTLPSPDHASISNLPTDSSPGYHIIWPRDLYYAAMGLLAAGDLKTPVQVLHYFRQTQRKDGSWPHSFWVDGTSQQDQNQGNDSTYAILLANQLEKRGVYHLAAEDLEMIRKATAFILSHGPTIEIDRWGERGGYIPAALATEVAALKSASLLIQDLETENVANQWQSSIETWTLIQNGSHGSNYYARLIPDVSLTSIPGSSYELFDEGFLNLVRLGIREPKDPRILNTLKIYEDPKFGIATAVPDIPDGFIFRKNNRPASTDPIPGGSYFPALAAEHGEYSVAAHQLDRAEASLFTLEEGSTPTGLLPEQLSTAPTSHLRVRLGVACPLVWAHAEDILLHRSIEEGTVFDAPAFK